MSVTSLDLRRVWPLPPLMVLLSLADAATLPPRPALTLETALAPGELAPLDQLTAAREAQHPGQSAFRLLTEGPEAFVIRARSARQALRSLDVQTFIWNADLSGKFLAHQLVEAADRSVKVRVLVDDMDGRDHNAHLAALAAHPNVAVRIFNPFASRRGVLSLVREGLLNFERLNRRMHNKSWIADNRIAIVGGRNLGDEYFGASDEMNFLDLDFAMIGPVVRDASASFDRYWNSAAAYPIELVDPDAVNAAALEALRHELAAAVAAVWTSDYADVVSADDAVQRLVNGDWPMQWSGNYRFVADDPHKATLSRELQHSEVRRTLLPVVLGMTGDLMILSPYFIPGESVTASLVEAAKAGKRIRVLTNSLAANDVAAVYGGYARYRSALLESGVQIWELKAGLQSNTPSDHLRLFRSRVSLHTKALLVDHKTVFVGSYNLDPRSAWLNCEQGVLVENEALAEAVANIFDRQISSRRAWHVALADGALNWSDGSETFSKDPHASAWQRFQVWILRMLRLEAHL